MFIRCLSDFDKSCRLAKGDRLWVLPLLPITLKLSNRSCFGYPLTGRGVFRL
jgi:hypothetical protein